MLGQLIAAAGAAGVQVIVETHSDHVLNGIRIAVKKGELASEKKERIRREKGKFVRSTEKSRRHVLRQLIIY